MTAFGSGYEIVTSASRPKSPVVGQVIFETDTPGHQWYDGSTWQPLIARGTIKAFAGATAPSGWLMCAGPVGVAVTQSAYPALFALLTTNGTVYPYGGSGATTYTPDLRGRGVHGLETMGGGSAVGYITAAGSGVDGASLAAVGGGEFMASHYHPMPGSSISQNENVNHAHQWTLGGNGGGLNGNDLPHRGFYGWDGNFATWGRTTTHVHSFSFSGGSAANSPNAGDHVGNMPPTIVLNYIIKY